MRIRVMVMISAASLLAISASGLPTSRLVFGVGSNEYYAGALNCARLNVICKESAYNRAIWPGQYVGHDEPGLAFMSNKPGSGNRMEYHFTLPSDPPARKPMSRSYNFELASTFWFGMTVCDTQSYPEQTHRCTPDSNSNITSLRRHPGSAYVEMQFYPPGWVTWPEGSSCAATQWCAALNIDSLSYDPLNDQSLNDSCSSAVAGPEYVNFAFITKNGKSQAPANPIQSSNLYGPAFTPNLKRDLLMRSGDRIDLKMFDTANGLQIAIHDLTTSESGSMTASAANGFGQIVYATNPSVECSLVPYDFHPMYSTATSKTILPWGATEDNIEFVDEIGHFDWCTGPGVSIDPTGSCPSNGYEGPHGNRASDYDDTFCLPTSMSSLVKVGGCEGANVPGYDGASYLDDWPNGDTAHRPSPTTFSSPLSGRTFSDAYQHAVFETDLPDIEPSIQCNLNTGRGCSHLPLTDEGTPAVFYPFFSTIPQGRSCIWNVGTDITGVTNNDFGRNAQYGPVLRHSMLEPGAHGKNYYQYTLFRHVLPTDPCAS